MMTDEYDDQAETAGTEASADGERIAKVLARAGICSRRDAEKMIAARRVAVNGTVLTSPAFNVAAEDQVTVDGELLRAPQEARLWRYHKPAGLVTTHKDPQGRPTVFDDLPRDIPRVVSVGRLDLNSEGLLLLTNDGALAGTLEHPSTAWARRYRVRVHGRVTADRLEMLADGVEIEGVRYGPVEAVIERQQGANCWLQVTLHEGKNREIRRLMEFLGYTVNRLIRVSYGPFIIGRLARGQVEEVPIRVLREALSGLGEAVPETLRQDKVNTTKWAKAKPRPVRPGYKKVVRPGEQPGTSQETEARGRRPSANSTASQNGSAERDSGMASGRGGKAAGAFAGKGRPYADRSKSASDTKERFGGERSGGERSGSGRPGFGRSGGGRSGSGRFDDDRSEGSQSRRGGAPGRSSASGGANGRGPEERSNQGRPGTRGPDRRGAEGRETDARSGGGRSGGGRSGGGRSDGGRGPRGRAPDGRSPGGRAPGGRPAGGRPAGGKPRGRSPKGEA